MSEIFFDSRQLYEDSKPFIDDNLDSNKNKSIRTKERVQLAKGKRLMKSLAHSTIRVKTSLNSYKYTRFTILFVLSLLASAGSELVTIFSAISEAQVMHNYMIIYAATIDCWDLAYVCGQALDTAILWGNKMTVMNMPAIETAKHYSGVIKNRVLEDYNSMRTANLGNYSQNYVETMFENFTLCPSLKKAYPGEFQSCGQGMGTILAGNVYSVAVKLHALLDNAIRSVEKVINNRTARTDILKESGFKAYRAFTTSNYRAWSEMYYRVMLPLSQNLNGLLQKDDAIELNINFDKQFYSKLYGLICLAVFFLIFFSVVVPLLHSIRVVRAMLQLFPVGLLITNRLLVQRIVKRLPRDY